MSFFEKLFGSFSDKELKRINPLKDKVLALEPEMAKLTDEELQAKTTEFKERLAKGETLDDLLPEAFAVCREAGIPVFQKNFSLTEVYVADEAFVTGTFAGVVPVRSIDGRAISAGRGPMVERLQGL